MLLFNNLMLTWFYLLIVILGVACNKPASENTKTAAQQKAATENEAQTTKVKEVGQQLQIAQPASQPMTLPGYTPTGDRATDEANYAKAKEALYNNPELFKQWEESQQSVQTIPASAITSPSITEIPYAEYLQMTKEKRDYIDAHPELYRVVK